MQERKFVNRQNMLTNIIDTTLYKHVEKNYNADTHSNRVSRLCRLMGVAMGLADDDVYKLEISGLFHDVGKLAIQDQVINKAGPLTDREWRDVMRHPEVGSWILRSSHDVADIAEPVLYHHERYDGTGYPKKLKGEEIPLLARIISVADSYDAMTNERSYKETLDQETAVEELINNRGKQFDPEIVDIFIEKVLNHKT